jgi:hypothetical protein
MSLRAVLPWTLTALLVLAAAGVFVGFHAPLRRDLDEHLDDAHRVSESLESLEGTAAGALYERSLQAARAEGDTILAGLERALTSQVLGLRRWFPRLGTVGRDEAPRREQFRDAYLFHQEELIREIYMRVKERTGVEPASPPPLAQPAFVAEGRLPHDLVEMRISQDRFNLEERLLLAAATAGTVTRLPPEMHHDYVPLDPQGRFLKKLVRLRLAGPEGTLSELLRALLALRREGPIVMLRKAEQRVGVPPAPGRRARVEYDVDLDVCVLAEAVAREEAR